MIFLDLDPPSERNKRARHGAKSEAASISASSPPNPLCDTHAPRAVCMKDEQCEAHSFCREVKLLQEIEVIITS